MQVLLWSIACLLLAPLSLAGRLYDEKYFIVQKENSIDVIPSIEAPTFENSTTYPIFYNQETYNCYIPEIKDVKLVDDTLYNNATTLREEKLLAIKIIEQFNQMHRQKNIITEAGYWQYMLRPGLDINQYHVELYEDETVMNMFKLAAWPELNPVTSSYQDSDNPYKVLSDFELITSQDGTRYVTQRVGNGEICDLTGLPRSTILNYKCSKDAINPRIRNIHEWRTCEYQMDVEFHLFCGISMWTQPPSMQSNDITCFPDSNSALVSAAGNETQTFHERLDMHNVKLLPFRKGIFLRGNDYKYDILLTKDYHLRGSEMAESYKKLLDDLIDAFEDRKTLVLKHPKSGTQVVDMTKEYSIGFDIYDTDLTFVGAVQINRDSNGVLVVTLGDAIIPDDTNFLK